MSPAVRPRPAALSAALLAAAASSALATPAQAGSLPLGYQCTYPLIGEQPLAVDVKGVFRDHLELNEANARQVLVAESRAGGVSHQGLAMVGAASIDGIAVAKATITKPDGLKVAASMRLNVGRYALPASAPADGMQLTATSQLPALAFRSSGVASISVDALRLTLTARDASGTPITALSKYQKVPATDTDAATFDVTCRLEDPSQDTTLARIPIGTEPASPMPERGPAPMPPTRNTTVDFAYKLSGTSEMRTKTTGTLPVAGSISTTIDLTTGRFHGPIRLEPATAQLNSAGLKVDVTNEYESVGEATGTLINGKLTSTNRVNIHVRNVFLGKLDLLRTAKDCHTKTPSDFTLSSSAPFRPLEGGTITGTFAISELVDCGALGTTVSNNTKGSGNLITMHLTPAN